MYYNLSSQWGQWGFWGLTNDPANLSSTRYAAAKQVAESAATSFTCR